MRALIKTALSGAIYRSGAAQLLRKWRGSAEAPLVLGYHRVVEDFLGESKWAIPSMLVTTGMLEQQLDWVGRHFRFTTLDDVAGRLESGEPFERPTAAVTFDDGYADVYTNAFPMMRRKGIPATVFVVSEVVGTAQAQQHDALYLLLRAALSIWKSPHRELAGLLRGLEQKVDIARLVGASGDPFQVISLMLQTFSQDEVQEIIRRLHKIVELDLASIRGLKAVDWTMLSEMQSAGFTIGSHTKTHALLTNETPVRVAEELKGSRRKLESVLGIPVTHLAYPDGRFTHAAIDAAMQAGYRFGYTICSHNDPDRPSMTIRRRVLWEKSCVDSRGRFSPDIMACQVAGAFDFTAPCTGRHESIQPVSSTAPVPAYEHVENC